MRDMRSSEHGVPPDGWPGEQPAWRRVAEQAADALRNLAPTPDGPYGFGDGTMVRPVASLRAVEALVELTDIAREWARRFDFVGRDRADPRY